MSNDAESRPKTLTRRRFLGVGGATLAGAALLVGYRRGGAPQPEQGDGATLAGAAPSGARATGVPARPNFLFVMVDDMSKWMLDHMPIVQQRVAARGMTFDAFYSAQPLCSPNRATSLSGLYPHNHGLVNNAAAARQFREKRLDPDTFATSLKSAGGYTNGFVGKYFNGYAASTENEYIPPGWDYWVGLASDENPTVQANVNGRWGDTGVSVTRETEWLADHVDSFIRDNAGAPWFCFFGPRAPHDPYTPSAASEHYADDIPLRRPANFNEPDDMSDKPTGVGLRLPPLNEAEIADLETWQEGKLEELQDVDAQVGRLLDTLAATDQLEDTYVFFTSDNGFMLGENRQQGKNLAYRASVELPLVVAGPSIAAGSTSGALASMADVRATLTNLAGISGAVAQDGRALTPLLAGGGAPPSTWRRRLLFERPPYGTAIGWHAVYDTRYVYVQWSSGQEELYDMAADAAQLKSIHASRPDLVRQYSSRLAALSRARGDALRRAEV